MSFKQILGHKDTINILQNTLLKNRLAHAYLFQGPEGVGKLFSAINFAKAINCLNMGKDSVDCCDGCESCKKINSSSHIDINIIKPLKGKSGVSIEQIRQMQSQVSLRPYEARQKVFLIPDAELVNNQAQSALLKTLEEPAAGSIIILTTSSPESLLGTIISRCQVVKFYHLSPGVNSDILSRRFGIEADSARFLSHIASTGMVDISTHADIDVMNEKNRIIDAFMGFLDRPQKELFFLKSSSDEVLWCLSILLWWYRDMLILKETLSPDMIVNKDRLRDLELCASGYNSAHIGQIINSITGASQLIAETNVNIKLALTVMATDILSSLVTKRDSG